MTVYRNQADSRRYVLHRRLGGAWDVDVWTRGSPPRVVVYSAQAGDAFRTRREAYLWAKNDAGSDLIPLPPRTHPEVTSAWGTSLGALAQVVARRLR